VLVDDFINIFFINNIFFCNNQRKNAKGCCSQFGAKQMYRYAKDKCRDEGKLGKGKIGVSESRIGDLFKLCPSGTKAGFSLLGIAGCY
jgi:hypothetical protein